MVDEVSPYSPNYMSAMTQTPASLVKGRGTGGSRWRDSFSMSRAIIVYATSSASHTLGTFSVQEKVFCTAVVCRVRSVFCLIRQLHRIRLFGCLCEHISHNALLIRQALPATFSAGEGYPMTGHIGTASGTLAPQALHWESPIHCSFVV